MQIPLVALLCTMYGYLVGSHHVEEEGWGQEEGKEYQEDHPVCAELSYFMVRRYVLSCIDLS